jgi:hypothetical protein
MARLLVYGLLLLFVVLAIVAVQRAVTDYAQRPPAVEPGPDLAAALAPEDPPPPPGMVAGWYPDVVPGRERWWDGTGWTSIYR